MAGLWKRDSHRLGPTLLFLCVRASFFFKAGYGFFQAASVWGFFNMKLVDPHNSLCNVCSWNSYLNYKSYENSESRPRKGSRVNGWGAEVPAAHAHGGGVCTWALGASAHAPLWRWTYDLYTVPLSKSASFRLVNMGKPSIQRPPLSKKNQVSNES